MARALWKGAITFGLVQHPGRALSRGRAQGVQVLDARQARLLAGRLQALQQEDAARKSTGTTSSKGYEYEKDQYVVLSDEDFRRANVKATQTIDIEAFVPADEIPPEYFDTPYYLAPTARGQKVYALLRETLRSTAPRRRRARS